MTYDERKNKSEDVLGKAYMLIFIEMTHDIFIISIDGRKETTFFWHLLTGKEMLIDEFREEKIYLISSDEKIGSK
jgi:hypothetical protein